MKKLTCTLLVAMFTMTTMLFAQLAGEPSAYFTITNKTTQESKVIAVNDFTSEGSNKSYYDVDLCLGVYNGDEIELTYTERLSLSTPRVVWSYFWNGNGNSSTELITALTANFPVKDVPYDRSTLTATCKAYGTGGSSKVYNINFKNVHNSNTRFYSEYAPSTTLRVTYKYYNEVGSCLKNAPQVSVYNTNPGLEVFRGYMNDNGVITFNTRGITGTFIVRVTVNNVTLPGEKIYLY